MTPASPTATAAQPTRYPQNRQKDGARPRTASPAASPSAATAEKKSGTYSDSRRKWFVECARKISPTSPAKLTAANASISHCRSASAPLTSTTPPQLVGHGAQLHRAREHRVVAVPLHEVGA